MQTSLFGDIAAFSPGVGSWTSDAVGARLIPEVFEPVGDGAEHAETHLFGVIGIDFTFGATVTFEPGADAHLQFRISGDGRYGVSLRESGIRIYRLLRKVEWVWETVPNGDLAQPLAARTPHAVSITCAASVFHVTVDGVTHRVEDEQRWIPAGRLGLYAFRSRGSSSRVVFSGVHATSNPAALSNFALLYSTVGYVAAGRKRALLRTINPLPSDVDLVNARFSVRRDGRSVVAGDLQSIPTTYGMQLWEADFSSLQTAGVYTLQFTATVEGQTHLLDSGSFSIDERTLSRRLLKPLTILAAPARNAAVEDFRRNWVQVSGAFRVADDGAFWAEHSDDQAGALLERTTNGSAVKLPLPEQDAGYTMTGEVSIREGCDAQLQFGITPTRRLGVTLQAGPGGGCTRGDGIGAIRLHEEGPDVPVPGFRILDARPLPFPFRAGQIYHIRIGVTATTVTVFLDSVWQFTFATSVNLRGTFGIKAWSSSARFDRVSVWRQGVGFDWLPVGAIQFIDRPTVLGSGPCDGTVLGETPGEEQPGCSPIFAQRTGFHDCNNIIGESNSHGAFVAGAVATWVSRHQQLSADDRRELKRAIVTGVAYLGHLFALAAPSGRYKHEALARGRGPDKDKDGKFLTYLSLSGAYGDLSFAAHAPELDPAQADAAMRRGWKACQWLTAQGLGANHRSLLYHLAAVCARRDATFAAFVHDDLHVSFVPVVEQLDEMARLAAEEFLFAQPGGFATIDGWRRAFRDTGQDDPVARGGPRHPARVSRPHGALGRAAPEARARAVHLPGTQQRLSGDASVERR